MTEYQKRYEMEKQLKKLLKRRKEEVDPIRIRQLQQVIERKIADFHQKKRQDGKKESREH